jgi:hypothetical protein
MLAWKYAQPGMAVPPIGVAQARPHSKLVEGGAEFEDAGADGFYWDGKGEVGGIVEEEDDAVEFAFAGAAGEREADGMEEVAAAGFEIFLQGGDDLFEALGGEGRRVEEEKGEVTDDVAGGVAGDGGLGVGRGKDLGRVVVEDEAEEVGEGGQVFGVRAEELDGAFGPEELVGSGVGG